MLSKISKARQLILFIQKGTSEYGGDTHTVNAQFYFIMCECYIRDKTIFDSNQIKIGLLRRLVIIANKLEFPISE
jgi:hypothetical protein